MFHFSTGGNSLLDQKVKAGGGGSSLGGDQQDLKAFTALLMMPFTSAVGPCGSVSF